MIKSKTQFIPFLVIAMPFIFFSSCTSDELASPPHDADNSTVEEGYTSGGVIYETKEEITIHTNDYTTRVNNTLSGRNSLTIDGVFALGNAMQSGTPSTGTKLVALNKFKFNADEQKETRRPQGAANYGKYVINSWYFTSSSTWKGNCKLTVADLAKGKYFNLIPVQFHATQTTKLKHIESHAGGLTVIDHYLYIASGTSILIFDLNKIYKVIKPTDPVIATSENFTYEYTYMTPQIGEMTFETLSGANASYLSLTEINSRNHFVVGNFYSEEGDSYDSGGKSMIWLLPVREGAYLYPTIETNATRQYTQIEPLFPSGAYKNTTVTRIQGALVKDNVLIINRSYSSETYQLIVMRYSDALVESPVLTAYFSGTPSSKHSYNNKNWLYGCEDLEYYNGRVWTVTEFPEGLYGDRAIYSADYDDVLSLMAPVATH